MLVKLTVELINLAEARRSPSAIYIDFLNVEPQAALTLDCCPKACVTELFYIVINSL